MRPLTEQEIRTAFVNCTKGEAKRLHVPRDLAERPWDDLDFLGWRDPRMGRRAYVVVPTLDGGVAGVLLRQAEARPRGRAQCSWCNDVRLPNPVVFWSARRAGSGLRL